MRQCPHPRGAGRGEAEPCALRGPLRQCWGEGSGGSVSHSRGLRRIHTAHPPTGSPTLMPRQRCGHPRPKCAKSIQSRDKKIYNLGGIQSWAEAAPCTQALAPSPRGAVGSGGGHPSPSKSRISEAGDSGSLEQQGQRRWWGPRGPGWGLWRSGPLAPWDQRSVAKPDRRGPLDPSPNTQGRGGSSLWVRASPALVGRAVGRRGPSGAYGPAPTSPPPGSPSRRQRCPSSWFCAR